MKSPFYALLKFASERPDKKEWFTNKMAQLGQKGGMKGGVARAMNLSELRLSAIGKMGAKARWGNTRRKMK